MSILRACLCGGGGPQIHVGDVTCGGSPHQSCKGDQIKMRDYMYMDWQVTPPKHVTSPNWGPSPPCKQALRFVSVNVLLVLSPVQNITHIFIRSSGPSLNLFMFVELAAVNHQGDKVQNRNSFYYQLPTLPIKGWPCHWALCLVLCYFQTGRCQDIICFFLFFSDWFYKGFLRSSTGFHKGLLSSGKSYEKPLC